MPHPNLAEEQAYITFAYDCAAAMIDRLRSLSGGGVHPGVDAAINRKLAEHIDALEAEGEALCFGRIDETDGDRWYIGRIGVDDEDRETVVVDWRAPIAEPFYRARTDDPLGIWRRRRFTLAPDGRELVDITDELLDTPPVDAEVSVAPERIGVDEPVGLFGRDTLLADLERHRTGDMRDIVATIQSHQDEIIRYPLESTLVVQGGPGTGKTAVGLHRAAWLLYNHRDVLERRRVLVVGPNPAFMGYIAKVLPRLGETAVVQLPVTGFVSGVRPLVDDPPEVARLKGDERMADVIARALDSRKRPVVDDLEFAFGRSTVVLAAATTAEIIGRLRERSISYNAGREQLRELLLNSLGDAYVAAVDDDRVAASRVESEKQKLRRSAPFERALDRMWPTQTPQLLLRDLLEGPRRLAAVGEGLLSAEEQRLLLRSQRTQRLEDVRWSWNDLPLLDEAAFAISGTATTFGHVIVDEAQDLSPMQLRMVGRRAENGSMTLLGDLAQSTGVWAHDSWDEILDYLPNGDQADREELTIGYRVPDEILELASRVLREAAPAVAAPESVRTTGEVPELLLVPVEELAELAVNRASALASAEQSVGIVASPDDLPALKASLDRARAAYGEALRDGLEQQITLVPAWAAKGLEFDCVVVVEPASIVDDAEHGLRLLYVALTRATRKLVIAHSRPLPDALSQEDDRESPTPVEPVVLSALPEMVRELNRLSDPELLMVLKAAADLLAARLE